jgi:hypothetical protein
MWSHAGRLGRWYTTRKRKERKESKKMNDRIRWENADLRSIDLLWRAPLSPSCESVTVIVYHGTSRESP